MIFSGKRNIIFPDNTTKIIFQRDFFEKTIFSEHLEKENMVFRAMPVVLNKTILATRQVSFFTKVTPVQSITDIVLLVC